MIRAVLIVAALIIAGVALYLAWGVYKVLVIDRKAYAEFWQERAQQPVPEGAIRLLAYGDSTFQGLGASEPMEGTVGRVATYLSESSGQPVHIVNRSVTGATTHSVVTDQLDSREIEAADVIIIAVAANDINRESALADFESAIRSLTGALPPEKTIMADAARVKGREPYQAIIEQYRPARGIAAAKLDEGFGEGTPVWQLTARDFFHPSDRGYEWWFAAFRPAVDQYIDRT